ncbi:MAG: FAD-dependent oxidoreductase [Actinobacteria bacterium]|nr:FAD-dependent oxidoreductase [Actinomycetota bacterium]
MPAPDHEFVVVGGGICGLTAAWELRHRDVCLLEAGDRVGGRILSHRRDPYWLNLGAHLLPAAGTTVDRLVRENGLVAIPVTGTLRGLAVGGKVEDSDRPPRYPLTLPLPLRERISFARTGLRLQRGVKRYFREGPRLEVVDGRAPHVLNAGFLDDGTFGDFLGRMRPTTESIFRCAVNRGPSTLETMSAGAGVGLFAHVWGGRHTITARNLLGGTGRLPAAMAETLGGRIRLRTPVECVRVEGDAAVIETADGTIRARQAVVAVPGPSALAIVAALPDDLRSALAGLRYRAFLSMAMLTSETGSTPWDHVYSVATPGRAFDMLFNHAQPLREGARVAGGSLMVYAGSDSADRLLEASDDEIRTAFLRDLGTVYPQAPDLVTESIVQRWPLGNTNAGPGRERIQQALELHLSVAGRIQLAGDYFTPLGTMETAATTGALAAARALAAG